MTALNGLLVDNRPMKVCILSSKPFELVLTPYKIEILVDASRAPAIPAPKGLSERIA